MCQFFGLPYISDSLPPVHHDLIILHFVELLRHTFISLHIILDLLFLSTAYIAGEIIRLVASVCFRLSVGALLLFEPFDLDFWHEGRS